MGAVLDKIVVVGHRGTGKSSLIQRWKTYSPELTFADLDQEIEKRAQKPIAQIFSENGESYFRELEKKVWESLKADVVAVGGGFNLDWISNDWQILWVRRDSDSPNRIFLDRPALSDYPKRFEIREKKFNELADRIYTIPEGLTDPDNVEKTILLNQFVEVGGAVTLPHQIYPGSLLEVRDDLEPRIYESSQLLYSVRVGNQFPPHAKVDWDIKKPIPKDLIPYIISTHGQSAEELTPYEDTPAILKYCPVVSTWSELKQGYIWQQQNPQKRSFLPRSKNGRWVWFRLWMKGKQPLNFWREGTGSSLDQPTLWEWLSHPYRARNFAAVLGSPIQHSYSPAYHKAYFEQWNLPFYRIHIEEDEWEDAMRVLDQMGLVAAAVTSPLKTKAGEYVQTSPLNTLFKKEERWTGTNTDMAGAKTLLEDYLNYKSVVWGGGGVLNTLKAIIPHASFYSSQTGKPREGFAEMQSPDVLVWGDPHNSIQNVPSSWNPKFVIDLSYHDFSPARLYAIEKRSHYISGLSMFRKQAQEQQKFWKF